VQILVIKGDRLWWKAKTLKRVGVGWAVKQKGIEALNIEIEMKDCEEHTTTFFFYVISGSNLSHSPYGGKELLEPLWSISAEGGCNRPIIMGEDTLERRCEGHDMSLSSNRLMTTGEDTLERRCEGLDMSPSSDRLMTMGEDTLERRCNGHDMSQVQTASWQRAKTP
jgi:hypothetical protein